MKLSQAIAAVPKSTFYSGRGDDKRVNYGDVFVEAVSKLLDANKIKYDKATLVKIAENVNLSSFQRAAAMQAAKYNPDLAEARRRVPAKPKAPRANPIDGGMKKRAPRGVDPITGQKKAKPAKPVVKAKRGIDPITGQKKTAAKKAAQKAIEGKTKDAATKKPAKKPARKPEIDPISGEPVRA